MPNILLETGYLSNRNDERFLKSASGQQKIAEAVLRAIQKYKGEYEKLLTVGRSRPDSRPTEVCASTGSAPGLDSPENFVYVGVVSSLTNPCLLPGLTYVTVLLGTVLWCTAFVAAPLLAGEGWSVADLLYASFHRCATNWKADLSFWVVFPWRVCALFLGVSLFPGGGCTLSFGTTSGCSCRAFAMVCADGALPMVVDVFAGILGASERPCDTHRHRRDIWSSYAVCDSPGR